MPLRWLQKTAHEFKVTLTRPGDQLTRGQRFLRLCYDLARHAKQELRHDYATTWAAALTYRTIFGLIPMAVMALIVFRAFGGFADSQQSLTDRVYDWLDVELHTTEVPAVPADPATLAQATRERALDQAGQAQSLLLRPYDLSAFKPDPEALARLERERANAEMRQKIDEFISGLAEGVTHLNVGSIGVFGALLLIWASLGLVVTVEKTFNVIYKAPAGRPWHLRIPIYWAIITLGPVLIWGSYYLSSQVITAAQDVWLVGDVVLWLFTQFSALVVTWLLFLLLFKMMPNAKVALRPAMAGALVSALAWELMKAALRWYINSAIIPPSTARLYGSLALIPIFLFWVYLTWIVVLAGLEVTHILQTLPASRVGRFEKHRPTPVARDPRLVIPVMSAIAQAFDRGRSIGVVDLADQLDAPPNVIATITDDLVGRGLLHRLGEDEGETLTLAMPPGRIRIADLIATTPEHDDTKGLPGHDLLMRLAEAQDAALADVTLAGRPAR